MSKIKKTEQRSLFEYEERLQQLSKKTNHLQRLNAIIPWEAFRPKLNEIFRKEPKGPGGAPHYDYLMMFKILILQKLYSLSDEQTEYQIYDRLSFQKFLGLTLSDDVPDEKTIWHFRECLVQAKAFDELFALFTAYLQQHGLIQQKGIIVDATFVEVPRQRNSRKENETIQSGKVPEEWEDNPHKLCQKDTDARWTKKRNISYFGYKDHIKIDTHSKFILSYHTTNAAVHDSQALEHLITEQDAGKKAYGDSACPSKHPLLLKYDIKGYFHKKGCRYKKLTTREKRNNREKSKVRCRVEHVFGCITMVMQGFSLKARGYARAHAHIALTNLVYNMCRMWQYAKV